MNETKQPKFRLRAAALAVISCLSLSPLAAQAAGLGKLTVLSGLGQPLRAEVDIGASREELFGMTARLAPIDVFRQAGVDLAPALQDLRFSVGKRADGQAVIKVSSIKPINEPFLDFLVELNWPSGRLIREYTFLLDPPEVASRQAARSTVEARPVDGIPEPVAAAPKSAERPIPVAKAPAAASKEPASTGTRTVQRGETLRKIASENLPEGVSLEQMLVGLFRANPDAFMGQNINRLKSGAILNIPDKTAVAAVGEAEAKKVYVAHAGNWNAYREKLAAAASKAPASADAGSQSASGKITAKVEDKAVPTEQGKDQVRVARTDAPAKSAAAEADALARDKALRDAQDRLATLEKNIADLQKLLELKNQKLADLEKAPKAEVKEPEPAKPIEPPKVEEPKPLEAAKPAEAEKPAEAPAPVPPPKPVEAPKKPLPPPPPPPPPPPEPSLVDELLDGPLPLAAGGILALLGGLVWYRRRQSKSSAAQTTAMVPGNSVIGPNSVFGVTGGQSIDTSNTPPQTGDFSQTGPGTIDTDEVDPVAEADVYMAYGRDAQAEEILLEALQKDSQRTAIHLKLLEIYAGRRSVKQFETLASELYALTAGHGPDWNKAAELGAALDPGNPLYRLARGGSGTVDTRAMAEPEPIEFQAPVFDEPLPEVPEPPPVEAMIPQSFERDTMILPAGQNAEAAPEREIEPEPDPLPIAEPAIEAEGLTLDFDLGTSTVLPPDPAVSPAVEPEPEAESEPMVEETPVEEPMAEAAVMDDADALDFDLAALGGAASGEQALSPAGAADEMPLAELDAESLLATPAERGLSQFSPEGTLVMPTPLGFEDAEMIGEVDEISAAVPAPTEPEPAMLAPESDDQAMMAFDLDDPASVETVVNPSLAIGLPEADFEPEMPASVAPAPAKAAEATVTADDLEFDVHLSDSMIMGQQLPEFDMASINLDLSIEPSALAPSAPAEVAEPAAASEPVTEPKPAAAAPMHDERWEEANTKLDLAKAYEEMGDLEGARELLQEVLAEGIDDLAEQARAMVERIGD